jgi:N-acetylglucosamine-6-phosphate deacetylase
MAVRNAVEFLGLTPAEAIKLASENPARVLGLGDRKGRIKPGYDADFSIIDEKLLVKSCYVAGKCVY